MSLLLCTVNTLKEISTNIFILDAGLGSNRIQKIKMTLRGGGKKDDCPHTLIAFTVFRAKKYNLRQYI